jgi:hypothetical protein
MGYIANAAHVIASTKVKELAPLAYSTMLSMFKHDHFDETDGLLAIVRLLNYDDPDDIRAQYEEYYPEVDPETDQKAIELRAQQYCDVFGLLQKEFTENTRVGDSELTLYIDEHDPDAVGSCYDEIDGVFFYLDGVQQYTPAAERLKDDISYVSYVCYG